MRAARRLLPFRFTVQQGKYAIHIGVAHGLAIGDRARVDVGAGAASDDDVDDASDDADAGALRARLYDALSGDRVSLEDLADLCFRLGLDWDNLSGDARPRKARSLVQHFARRGELPRLRAALLKARPDLKQTLQ